MNTPSRVILTLALALGAFSPATTAQLDFPAASPNALVRDQVGLTTVEVEYARPGVKGRAVFGGLIPYGEIWRTGANAATKISFSTDVTFGGEAVEAGTYALFTIPGKREWTIILNAAPQQWGSYGYTADNDVVRVVVETETLKDSVETMRLGFDHLRSDSAHLTFAWENTGFRVPVAVDIVAQLKPRIEEAMASESNEKPYLAAAMFYYEHDLDLVKALDWIDAALEQQPQAVWVQYRKGLIQAKKGDRTGALDSANKALAMADAIPGELGDEYRRLSQALLDAQGK